MSKPSYALLHPGVQEAIWSMGWKELKPIQTEAIHAICETENHIVICAQTAGGKTEAAFLPVISKLAENPQPSVQVLYIGPLKALINDQFGRLEGLCEHLDIQVHRWHGDVPTSHKRALRETPSGILLITPESLESNFINFGTLVPKVYRDIAFVVIDELHSFLGNVRGIHLQSLLGRLAAGTGRKPRMIGLSATLADPKAACFFLAPDGPGSVQVIEDANSKRELKFGVKTYLRLPPHSGIGQPPRLQPAEALLLAEEFAATNQAINGGLEPFLEAKFSKTESKADAGVTDELDEIAEDIIRSFRVSTNLIFGNSKQSLEILADRLHERVRLEKWPADPFVVHHGSLSKDLREDAEASLKSGLPTTALCSSTLEMGIDIGSVRAVGQIDTPWAVASMVQRLGRSGRRPGEAAIMRLYVREESPNARSSLTDLLYPDLVRAIAMTHLMLAKWLEPADTNRMHLSTLIHQILSCLKQTGGLHAARLFQPLCECGPFRNVTKQQFQVLLRGLGENQLVEQIPQGELILGLVGERIANSFDFYAAFKSVEEFAVRTGSDDIGKLPADLIPPLGEFLILAGRRWRVDQIDTTSKQVFVSLSPGGKAVPFKGSGGELHPTVMCEMKAVLLSEDEPAYLDENSKILLRAARRVFRAADIAQSGLIKRPQSIQWFPWAGTRCHLTLALLAKAAGIKNEMDRLSITYHIDSLSKLELHFRSIVEGQIDELELVRRMPIRAVDKFDEFVPEELLDTANARDRLDIKAAEQAVEACRCSLSTDRSSSS
jgi:ATP-dependent Lhr-like helicase